jgi:hypothetical protein
VVSLKFIEQFGEMEWSPQGLEAHLFGDLYGATKVAP